MGNGRFTLLGREIQVSRNLNNKHQLHGGFVGFDKVHWQVVGQHEDGVTLQHCSADGHEGYPGEVTATVKFALTEDNCLHVQMQAKTTKTTAVNLTNHSYFNLAGHVSISPDELTNFSLSHTTQFFRLFAIVAYVEQVA